MLIAATSDLPEVAAVDVDVRLNADDGIKFQSDVMTVDRNGSTRHYGLRESQLQRCENPGEGGTSLGRWLLDG